MSGAGTRKKGNASSSARRQTPEVVVGRLEGERLIAFALCALAALRVFLFSAGFPFFNNVDEGAHFDLVRKYARGHIPTGLEPYDGDTARAILLFGTPEYLRPPSVFPGGTIPPPRWTLPTAQERLDSDVNAVLARITNHEATQPPLYYAVAGAWLRLGEAIGMRDGLAIYWVRFLNVPLCGLLTWLAYAFARTSFDRRFLRLGIPMLVAFIPQDVFYSVNNDVLQPLCGGVSFLLLSMIATGPPKSHAFHALTGACVGATILVKFSGVAILPIMLAVAILMIVRPRRAQERMRAASRGAVLLLSSALPILVWCLRNYFVLGDVTGSVSKAEKLSWSLKPVGAFFDHPIFTLGGLWAFLSETMTTFWRGEFVWGLQRIASDGWDAFYQISSLVFVAAAVLVLATRVRNPAREPRTVLWLSLIMFGLSLSFLGVISVIYDFEGCFYPSAVHPFLTSGRLALGALIPFAALWVYGLDALLPAKQAALRWALGIAFVILMTVSEALLSREAFGSAYNWFHMI